MIPYLLAAVGGYLIGDSMKGSEKFADGGVMDKADEQENLDMVKNQAIQIQHHAKELIQTLKSNPKVEAWVVAKMDRATSNLSDITHYLEGEKNYFADGGNVDNVDGFNPKGIKVGDTVQLTLIGTKGKVVEIIKSPAPFVSRAKISWDDKEDRGLMYVTDIYKVMPNGKLI